MLRISLEFIVVLTYLLCHSAFAADPPYKEPTRIDTVTVTGTRGGGSGAYPIGPFTVYGGNSWGNPVGRPYLTDEWKIPAASQGQGGSGGSTVKKPDPLKYDDPYKYDEFDTQQKLNLPDPNQYRKQYDGIIWEDPR